MTDICMFGLPKYLIYIIDNYKYRVGKTSIIKVIF